MNRALIDVGRGSALAGPSLAAALVSLLLGCGCDGPDPAGPVPSTDLATSEISLFVELRSNGGLAQVFAHGARGYDTVVITDPDALLVAAGNGAEIPLVASEAGYVAQLATDATAFRLLLARAAGRVESPIDLPPPFALSGPTSPASRSQPIPVTWDAGAGAYDLTLRIGGACLDDSIYRHLEADVGAYNIQPADLGVPLGVSACDLAVELTRSIQSGALSPELAPASRASVEQIRTLTVPTVP